METLKFLLVTSYYPPNHVGGDAMHVKHLADLLSSLGHSVVVVCSESAARRKGVFFGPSARESRETVVSVSSQVPRLQVGLAYVANRDKKTAEVLNRVARELKPDVVHYHNLAAIGTQDVRGGWRTLDTVHDYWPICQRGDLLKYGQEICVSPDCFVCAIRSGLPPQLWRKRDGTVTDSFAPDIVLAPSAFALNMIRRRLPIFAGRLVHCPNFVPDVGTDGLPSPHRSHDNLLFVGSLTKQKGVEGLVRAVLLHPSVTLTVAGDGPELSRLRRIVTEAGAQGRVRIIGRVPTMELNQLYRNVQAVVIPSIWPENAPLVALEALSASTPVLGARIGGLPEVLDPIDEKLCRDREHLLGQLDDLDWLDGLRAACRLAWESQYSPRSFQKRYFRILEGGLDC